MHNKSSGVKGSLKTVNGDFQGKVCIQGRIVVDVAESMNNGADKVEGYVYLETI